MTEKTDLTAPDDAESMSVASALIRARTELGMTQAALADVSGVSRSAIKGYETGRNMPGARELKALCSVLRVTPNSLLFGTETPFSGSPLDSEQHRSLRQFLSETESVAVKRTRITALAALLTTDEAASLLTLVHGLAMARHGPEVVKKAIFDADTMATMLRTMIEGAKPVLSGDAAALDPEAIATAWADSLERLRHGAPNDVGTPKVSKKSN